MTFSSLTHEIAAVLPEYMPGVSTGTAAPTESRACWVKSWKKLLTALGHKYEFAVVSDEDGDCELSRQLSVYWKRGDGIMAAFLSGWGSRDDLEHRFQKLETIKSPQKTILYSCARWQDAVLEQLESALLRYPHHLQGEQYLLLNLIGSERRLVARCITMPRMGEFLKSDLELLQQVPGSPFDWGKH